MAFMLPCFIRLVAKKHLLESVLLLLVTALFFLLAFDVSPSLVARFPARLDLRFPTVDAKGWFNGTFTVEEPALLGRTTKLLIAVDEGQLRGPIQCVDSEGKDLPPLRKGLYALPSADPFSFKGSFSCHTQSGEPTRLRLSWMKFSSRGLPFLLPNPSTMGKSAATLLFLGLIPLILFRQWNKRILTPLFPLLFFSHFLSRAPLDSWHYLDSLFLPFGGIVTLLLIYTSQRNSSASLQDLSKKQFLFFLSVGVLLALGLRLSGIDFGIPRVFHPDESRKLKIAYRILTTGDLNPHYFRHPSFLLYSTAFLGKVRTLFDATPLTLSELHQYGRSISAVLGALSVGLVGALGAVLYSRWAGILAAVLLAVNPLHVVCSRYIKEDAALLFFLLAALLSILWFLKRSSRITWLLLGGLLLGGAMSVKYAGALGVGFLGIPWAVYVLHRTGWLKELPSLPPTRILMGGTGGALIASIVGFLAITPFAVLDFPTFLKDFSTEGAHIARGHGGAFGGPLFFYLFHFKESILPALTFPASWILLAAALFLLTELQWETLLLLVLTVVFYLPPEQVNAKPFPQPERYILPCIPFIILAASGAAARFRLFRHPLFFLVVTTSIPLLYSVNHLLRLTPDTRDEATAWVTQHIPPHAKVLVDWSFYGPVVSPEKYEVRELKLASGMSFMRTLSVEELQKEGIEYVIFSSFFTDRYLRQIRRGLPLALGFKEIYELTPLQKFSRPGYAYGFHNPTITIFKVPPS